MSFEITITEIRTVKKIVGRDWAIIREEEQERSPLFRQPDEPKTHMIKIRGYTPEIEKRVCETREVLSQMVDELDLASVIKAINGL